MTETAMVTWLDVIAGLWAGLDTGDNQSLRSCHILGSGRMEYPEGVGENEIPIALTLIKGVDPRYSRGGPCRDMYYGWTEFFLTKSLDKQGMAKATAFLPRIRNVFSANMLLSGVVSQFAPDESVQPNIEGPIALQYGLTQHYGIVVHWKCWVDTAGMTVGDPSVA